ncbi:MAG: MiaB/RimO family radical SAM methylthiotransferase, partial [Pyrinomonadaceae bacterium]|nr:MiaB/RimO family radical SAM methylthiotransferase [Pyrinomonadaceae bacterium]
QGVKEVHLIGQNVNSYRPGTDSGLEIFEGATPFSRLLRAVAATDIERIKFTTSFPRDFHPDIVDAIEENENLCNWVHLPVQSGSDKVLKDMRRGHTVDKYKAKIDRIRSSKRGISLTTDIIIGFPGETDEDFQKTLDLAEYCEFDSAYIFKYSPRPGTPASELDDDVSKETKKLRFIELQDKVNETQQMHLNRSVGQELEVLAEKIEENKDGKVVGRSSCHKLVYFDGEENDLNTIVNVKVHSAGSSTVQGNIV